MRKLGPPYGNLYESYKKYNIEVIENTEEEILDATKEMFLKLNNEWVEDEETQSLKNEYLSLLWKDYDYGNLCKYPIISKGFCTVIHPHSMNFHPKSMYLPKILQGLAQNIKFLIDLSTFFRFF